jgi:hypothetical protein
LQKKAYAHELLKRGIGSIQNVASKGIAKRCGNPGERGKVELSIEGDYPFGVEIGVQSGIGQDRKNRQVGGVLFNKLFSLRQEADYEDFTEIKADEITPMLPEVERLIYEIDELIKKEDDR